MTEISKYDWKLDNYKGNDIKVYKLKEENEYLSVRVLKCIIRREARFSEDTNYFVLSMRLKYHNVAYADIVCISMAEATDYLNTIVRFLSSCPSPAEVGADYGYAAAELFYTAVLAINSEILEERKNFYKIVQEDPTANKETRCSRCLVVGELDKEFVFNEQSQIVCSNCGYILL